MLIDLGLLLTAVVALGLAARVLGGAPRRFQVTSAALLGVSAALWAIGELCVRRAAAPEEVLLGRRLLYLGTALLPVAWLWTATTSAQPRWIRPLRALLGLALGVQLALYSCLYWDTSGRFVHWTAFPPRFGPLFWVHAALGWSLISLGIPLFVRASARRGKAGFLHTTVLASGATLPLAVNVSALAGLWPMQSDPTPIAVGVSVILMHYAIFEAGLTAYLPIARRDVIEQLGSGVVVADLDRRVVDANPAAAGLFGEEDVRGRSLDELIGRARSDSTRLIDVHAFPVSNPSGIAGHCAVFTDRTAARRTELRLLQAQKLEAIGFLTAGIAHEVNNPLAYIQSNLGVLEELAKRLTEDAVRAALPRDTAVLAAEAEAVVDELRDGVTRLARLVERLGQFARGNDLARRDGPVDLRGVAERAMALGGVGLPSGAVRSALSPVPPVLGDEQELVQIALNLLLNAVHAEEHDPEIEVAVGHEPGAEGFEVVLAVRDRGPGIPDALLPHIFDPFFSTKAPGKGMGLGLSVCMDLAQRHGGRIEVSNRPDGGACFELRLPAARA